ncbi:MAG: homocysteine biosynthesis protein, partial [Candidatus Methanomethylophilaceae archaeon]
LVREKGVEKAAEEVDVVTTGTFGAMCSSGAFMNFGHSDPPIRMVNIRVNGVEAYGGLAAVDTYIGATAESQTIKGYGGAHVIADLIAGKRIDLEAWGPGTDCYVRKSIKSSFTLDELNEAYLFNPRNVYQNYGVATNTSDRTLHTYMGKLLPRMKNATYSSAGQLSPLLNDPHLETIGAGTRIFLGGGIGYVAWNGTQFNTTKPEKNGVPVSGARTLALIGDMKQMDSKYVRGLDIYGYGTSLAIGVGVPIPILNPGIMKNCSIADDDIYANMMDYSITSSNRPVMKQYSYAELKRGVIEYEGHGVRTSPLSSYRNARAIANELKDWIEKREFELTVPSFRLPDTGVVKSLEIRE